MTRTRFKRPKWTNALFTLISTLMIAGVAVILAPAQSPSPIDTTKLGVHLLLDDGRNTWDTALWQDHIAAGAEALPPGGFAVQVIRLDDLDAEKWQHFIDLCVEHDLTPVLRLATTFDHDNRYWNAPTMDADAGYTSTGQAYADFITALDWGNLPIYVMLLNEPNNGHEWRGRPDPAGYARFLADVSQVLKEQIPDIQVMNGALDLYSPDTGGGTLDGFAHIAAPRFLREMLMAEPSVFDHIDIWNSHAYPLGAFRAPPWEQVYQFDAINDADGQDIMLPPTDIANRGINGYEWELWQLEQFGVIANWPIFIGEIGWRYAGDSSGSLDAGDGYPTPQRAAAYLHMALVGNEEDRYPDDPSEGWTPLLRDERVIGVVVFALNGTPAEWAHTNLLTIAPDGIVSGSTPLLDVLQTITEEHPPGMATPESTPDDAPSADD